MPFDVNEVIILEMMELTPEEKVGARYIINQILDNVECKLCLLSLNDDGNLQVENYGLTDKEDELYMKYLENNIHEFATNVTKIYS